jgi:BD-FAE
VWLVAASAAGSGKGGNGRTGADVGETREQRMSAHRSRRLTGADTIGELLNHPAFAGFGLLLLPWDDRRSDPSLQLRDIGSLLPYHSHVDPGTVVDGLNHMIADVNSGRIVFYDFYTAVERRQQPAKANTGRQGYSAFVLKYRAGAGGETATRDLAAALSFVFRNAATLNVSREGYSLWGSSAGARMAAAIGSTGAAAFGGDELPRPSAVVMAYTGHSAYAPQEPPTSVSWESRTALLSLRSWSDGSRRYVAPEPKSSSIATVTLVMDSVPARARPQKAGSPSWCGSGGRSLREP